MKQKRILIIGVTAVLGLVPAFFWPRTPNPTITFMRFDDKGERRCAVFRVTNPGRGAFTFWGRGYDDPDVGFQTKSHSGWQTRWRFYGSQFPSYKSLPPNASFEFKSYFPNYYFPSDFPENSSNTFTTAFKAGMEFYRGTPEEVERRLNSRYQQNSRFQQLKWQLASKLEHMFRRDLFDGRQLVWSDTAIPESEASGASHLRALQADIRLK